MARRLSPPALQHVARTAEGTPQKVAKALLKEFSGRAPFRYSLMDELAKVAMKGRFTLEQFREAVRKRQRNPKYQGIFLELVPLVHKYFSQLSPKYLLQIDPLFYRINNLSIPFKPPFAFEMNDELIIPFLLFWKINPLTEHQYSLLATMIADLLSQHPDYRGARVLVLTFSAPTKDDKREIKIIDLATITRLTQSELDSALGTWFEGFQLAKAQIATMPHKVNRKQPPLSQQNLLDPPEK
jgi:hypothetical protein